MSDGHGALPRGLMSTKRSPLFESHFGRMFRSPDMAQFGATDADNGAALTVLGSKMSADFDPPKVGPDEEESGIPALYTYLGPLIDHDITFDGDGNSFLSRDPCWTPTQGAGYGLEDFVNYALGR